MQVKTIALLPNLTLYLVPTEKFKTVEMNIIFKGKVDPKLDADLMLLAEVLSDSCRRYPKKREVEAYCDFLYRFSFRINNEHQMESDNFTLSCNFISPRYLPDDFDIVDKVFEFIHEIIYRPLLKDGAFDSEVVKIQQQKTITLVNQFNDSKEYYSLLHLNDYINGEHPYKHSMIASEEELKKVTPQSLYAAYLKLLERPISIFIVGKFNELHLNRMIIKHLRPGNEVTTPRLFVELPYNKMARYEVTKHFKQSQLSMVFLTPDINTSRVDNVALLFNYIFGSGSTSKLFKVVREEHNYCYTINSQLRTLSNSLVVSAGIDDKNYEDTILLVYKQLDKMAKGEISDEEFTAGVESLKSQFMASEDNGRSIIVSIMNNLVRDLPYLPPQERVAELEKISKADVVRFAKGVRFSYSFLLRQRGEK
ncbi:MAG: insulinase family protein [Bacilli bacterium]|nr:insulinase family protein [Bacilli bacterium]